MPLFIEIIYNLLFYYKNYYVILFTVNSKILNKINKT